MKDLKPSQTQTVDDLKKFWTTVDDDLCCLDDDHCCLENPGLLFRYKTWTVYTQHYKNLQKLTVITLQKLAYCQQ